MPGEVSLGNLVPELARVLQLPATDSAGRPITYQLVLQPRQRPLHKTDTLLGAGVVTGDILSLVSVASPVGAAPVRAGGGYQGASALLRSAAGTVIALDNYGKAELTVGRYDARTGKSPDIDLSAEPDGSTVSRSHALLRRQGHQWALISLAARNRTRVGKTMLTPQQSCPLKAGDVITLGEVTLVFEAGRP